MARGTEMARRGYDRGPVLMAAWTGHERDLIIRDNPDNRSGVWTPERVSTFPGPIPRKIKGQLSLWTRPMRAER